MPGHGHGKYDESTELITGVAGHHHHRQTRPLDWLINVLSSWQPRLQFGRPTPNVLTYFDLPGAGFSNSSGNERYYDFVEGPIHFFALNSNKEESDGTSSRSRQAIWLKAGLAASTSTWNVVYEHHPPYSSDLVHGSTPSMQWPFASWGADAVLSGHAHAYERIERDGVVYFVNG
jgi:hypothetical protein